MYDNVQKLEAAQRSPHHPKGLPVLERIFDNQVLVHARQIVRMVTSHPAIMPTPQHQEYPLIHGAPNTPTTWVPLGIARARWVD